VKLAHMESEINSIEEENTYLREELRVTRDQKEEFESSL